MASRTAEEWRRLVGEWRASGLPGRSFAMARGVNAHTLAWWAWRLRSRARGLAEPTVTFAEVVVAEPARPFIVEVGGVRVQVPAGFDAGELRRLVGALC
jgi:hypothetical protein